MRIKKIILENFKSFAGLHEIDLDYNFVAITGPNGSGKSNIVDALLFVLGTKSPKAIRTEKFAELIFNGGKVGKPADYCSVTVVFDNSNEEVPGMPEVIEIKRTVRRSPRNNYNNYYYINGRRATATDVESLLSMLGVTQGSMCNIVLQGDITKVALMSPKERANLIAEISGIKAFDESIERAKEDLVEVENNINVAKSVLEELRRRLDYLRVERDKALKYLEIKGTMRSLEKELLLRKLEISEEKLKKKLEEKAQRIQELEDTKKTIESLSTRLEEIVRRIRDLEESMITRSSALEELSTRLESLRKDRNKVMVQIGELKSKYSSLTERGGALKEKIKEVNNDIVELEKRLDERKIHVERITKELEELEETIRRIEDKMKKYMDPEKQKTIERLQDELSRLETEITKLNERKSALETILKEKRERNKLLMEKLSSLKEEKRKLSELYNERKEELERLNFELSKIYARMSEVQRELDNVESLIMITERELESLMKEHARLEATLGRISEEERVFISLKEAQTRGELSGIVGRVIDVIKIPEEYLDAVIAAGGSRLNAIITNTDEDAEKAVEYLRRHKIGRATFLPLNKMRAGKPSAKAHLVSMESGSYGFVKDLVEYDKKYEPAIWYAFTDTVLVENLRIARKYMGGVRLVTLSGDIIEMSGAITGGYSRRSIKVGDRTKLESIAMTIEAKKNQLKEYRNRAKALNDEYRKISSQYYNLRDRKEKISVELKSIEERLKVVESSIREIEVEDLSPLVEEINDVSDKLNKLIHKRDETFNEIRKLREEIDVERYKELSLEREKVIREYKKAEHRLVEGKSELKSIETSLRRVIKERKSLEKELKGIEEDLPRLKEKIEDKERELREIETSIAMIKQKIDESKSALSEAQQEYYAKKEERTRIESDLERLKYKADVLSEEILDLTREIEGIESHLESLRESLREYDDVEASKTGLSVEELQRRISDLRIKLASLEPVNMLAIEEYEREYQRYEEREKQLRTLEEERSEILSLIKSLERRKREKFMRVFNDIRKNLKRIYSNLSGGGYVDLILENPGDPTSSGIIMIAAPPGKKRTRIEALSGGERSLVALSFIFAIQEIQPSPFYVLDEADMFLDAINAENVGRMLRERSRNSQFIVISLRRPVLKYADVIIGITQPKKRGVSEILTFPGVQDVPRAQ
ncbi:MAG: chromosome segregation protein SMC [Euryarchaeota archaeon]|nr:chromosome segregation protein SMC [Euryarchaeota archaeon]